MTIYVVVRIEEGVSLPVRAFRSWDAAVAYVDSRASDELVIHDVELLD